MLRRDQSDCLGKCTYGKGVEENKAQMGIAISEAYVLGMKGVVRPNVSRVLIEAIASFRAIKICLLPKCLAICW